MGRGGSAREDSRPTKTEGGLGDSSRAGSQTADAQSRRDALIAATLQTKPQGMSHWSCRTMAQAQGVSKNTVNRLWQLHNLKPHLSQTFKLSRDPKFVEKLTDVVGLYLNPPQQALVLCVEEKSQIQALDRTQPGLPLKIRWNVSDSTCWATSVSWPPQSGSSWAPTCWPW